MFKKIATFLLRSFVVLLAVGVVAGGAYLLVPNTATNTNFGERQRPNFVASAPTGDQQLANRPTDRLNAPRGGDFERGGRGGATGGWRGFGQLFQYTLVLAMSFGAVVLGIELFRRFPRRKTTA